MVMEKRTPHCKLAVVRTLVDAGQVRTTRAAREGGAALGFDFDGMLAIVRSLTRADFYKSMTTHADHRVCRTYIAQRRRPARCISS